MRKGIDETQDASSSKVVIDPDSWVSNHGDYLFRFALKRMRDAQAAEEVVQETFIAALTAKERFEGRSSERTWLTGILKYKVLDHFRKQSRDRVVTSQEQEDPLAGLFDASGHWTKEAAKALHDWRFNPDDSLRQKEFLAVLKRCLQALPQRLHHAFVLRELEDKTTPEICNILAIQATNLGVMLFRARTRLRGCLESNWFATNR